MKRNNIKIPLLVWIAVAIVVIGNAWFLWDQFGWVL